MEILIVLASILVHTTATPGFPGFSSIMPGPGIFPGPGIGKRFVLRHTGIARLDRTHVYHDGLALKTGNGAKYYCNNRF